jgi:drug/metabolite transporter (DMT)-like permease
MTTERLRVWIGFSVVSMVWGSTWLAIKIGLATVPPLIAAGVRFAVASLLLGIIVYLRRVPVPFTSDARKVYLSLGILSISIPFALAYWGQQFIPTGLSSVLFAAYPFWVTVFAHFLLQGERLSLFKIAGVVSGFLGVCIIFWGDVEWTDPRSVEGMVAVVVSCVLQAFSLVLVKKYGQPISPLVMNLAGMLIGTFVLLGAGFVSESGVPIVWTGPALLSVLYLATVGSVLAFVTYYWLLKRIAAVYLSLTSFINPIVAVILGAVVLGERLPPSVFGGAALVLLGILTANGKELVVSLRRNKECS